MEGSLTPALVAIGAAAVIFSGGLLSRLVYDRLKRANGAAEAAKSNGRAGQQTVQDWIGWIGGVVEEKNKGVIQRMELAENRILGIQETQTLILKELAASNGRIERLLNRLIGQTERS